jgi:hypothetical protein
MKGRVSRNKELIGALKAGRWLVSVLLSSLSLSRLIETTLGRRIHRDCERFGDSILDSAPESGSTMRCGQQAHPLPHLHTRFKTFLPALPLQWSSLTHVCSATRRVRQAAVTPVR